MQLLYYDFAGLVPAFGNAEIILPPRPDVLECVLTLLLRFVACRQISPKC